MKYFSKFILVCAVVGFGVSDVVFAQMPLSSSSRVYRTQRSNVENPGIISFMLAGSLYVEPYEYIGLHEQVISGKSTMVEVLKPLGYLSMNLLVDVNISERFMIFLGINILQGENIPQYAYTSDKLSNDTVGLSVNLLGYIRLGFKYSPLVLMDNRLQFSVIGSVYFPGRDRANQIFVSYTEGVKNIYLGLGTSIYFGEANTRTYLKIVPSIHLNYGVEFSIDNIRNISLNTSLPNEIVDLFPTSTILFGKFSGAFEFPIRAIDPKLPNLFLAVEASGMHPINKLLPLIVYSRETYIYVTGLLRVEPFQNWSIEAGVEGLVYGNQVDETDYGVGEKYSVRRLSVHNYNYPPIRGFFGIRFDVPYVEPPFYTAESEVKIDELQDVEDYEQQRYDLVFKSILQRANNIKKVYAYARRQDSTIRQGKIVFHLKVDKNGRTDEVVVLTSTFYPTDAVIELEKNLVGEIQDWKYPKGKSDFIIRFLQFEFLNDGELYISG